MSADPFCPCHGRASRPIEVPGLRCDCRSDRGHIYQAIDDERTRQQRLFGDQSIAGRLSQDTRLRILVEEVGEVAMAIDQLARGIETGGDVEPLRQHLREELVQVAACAVGWLEGVVDGGKRLPLSVYSEIVDRLRGGMLASQDQAARFRDRESKHHNEEIAEQHDKIWREYEDALAVLRAVAPRGTR